MPEDDRLMDIQRLKQVAVSGHARHESAVAVVIVGSPSRIGRMAGFVGKNGFQQTMAVVDTVIQH